MVNGVTKVIMTKADVLDNFKELQVCTTYKIDGKESLEVPFQMTRHKIEPVLQRFEGWNCNTIAAKTFASLPDKMKTYVSFINQYVGADVSHISNGPGRDQIVEVD
jgi:adenylosuccinate synthase